MLLQRIDRRDVGKLIDYEKRVMGCGCCLSGGWSQNGRNMVHTMVYALCGGAWPNQILNADWLRGGYVNKYHMDWVMSCGLGGIPGDTPS